MYGDSVVFLGVSWNGADESMLDFIARHGITFPTIVDHSGEVYLRFQVPYQPAWVFIDAAGNHTRVMGTLDSAGLAQYVRSIT